MLRHILQHLDIYCCLAMLIIVFINFIPGSVKKFLNFSVSLATHTPTDISNRLIHLTLQNTVPTYLIQ